MPKHAPLASRRHNFEQMVLAKQRQWVHAGWSPARIRAEVARLKAENNERMAKQQEVKQCNQ